jgi:hypothetical protein
MFFSRQKTTAAGSVLVILGFNLFGLPIISVIFVAQGLLAQLV